MPSLTSEMGLSRNEKLSFFAISHPSRRNELFRFNHLFITPNSLLSKFSKRVFIVFWVSFFVFFFSYLVCNLQLFSSFYFCCLSRHLQFFTSLFFCMYTMRRHPTAPLNRPVMRLFCQFYELRRVTLAYFFLFFSCFEEKPIKSASEEKLSFARFVIL